MASTRGRQVVLPLTNKSGGAVAAGDVVVIDTSNNEAFTTSTAGAVTGGVGIAQEAIASNATGRVLVHGYAALVNVNASVTRGNYGKTHTVAKQATDAGASRVAGAFCQFLTGGATPSARVYSPDLGAAAGNVAADAIWDAAGDLAQGTGSDTAAKLSAVAVGKVLVSQGVGTAVAWGYPPFHGCKVYNSTTQGSVGAAVTPLAMNTNEFDTDNFHFTSSANLTGTVTKTASSVSIVGSGTLFTSELSVNQVISIPGTAAEIGVVRTIIDNTHLDLWQTMANSASGQTATRKNEYVAIPAGMGGYYHVEGSMHSTTSSATRIVGIQKNGAQVRGDTAQSWTGTGGIYVGTTVALAQGDYVNTWGYSQTTATTGDASNIEQQNRLTVRMLGV